jgi:hypothetical protein
VRKEKNEMALARPGRSFKLRQMAGISPAGYRYCTECTARLAELAPPHLPEMHATPFFGPI